MCARSRSISARISACNRQHDRLLVQDGRDRGPSAASPRSVAICSRRGAPSERLGLSRGRRFGAPHAARRSSAKPVTRAGRQASPTSRRPSASPSGRRGPGRGRPRIPASGHSSLPRSSAASSRLTTPRTARIPSSVGGCTAMLLADPRHRLDHLGKHRLVDRHPLAGRPLVHRRASPGRCRVKAGGDPLRG